MTLGSSGNWEVGVGRQPWNILLRIRTVQRITDGEMEHVSTYGLSQVRPKNTGR